MDIPRFGVEIETNRASFETSSDLFILFRGVANAAVMFAHMNGEQLEFPSRISVQPRVSSDTGTEYILTTGRITDGFDLQERQFRLGIIDDEIDGTIVPTLRDLDTGLTLCEDITAYEGMLWQMRQAYLYDRRQFN